MRWAGHVARMGGSRRAYRFWYGNLSKTDHLEDLGVDGNIMLKMNIQETGLRLGLD